MRGKWAILQALLSSFQMERRAMAFSSANLRVLGLLSGGVVWLRCGVI